MSLVIIEKYLGENAIIESFPPQRVIQNNLFFYNLLYFIILITFYFKLVLGQIANIA